MARHRDILAGIRLKARYRLFGLLARPSSELTSAETLIAFALVLLWGAVFLGLCIVPFVVAGKLQLEGATPALAGAALIAAYAFARVGKGVWDRVSSDAA